LRKLAGVEDVSVTSIPFVAGLNDILGPATEDELLRAYLRWHVLNSFANHLPKQFIDGHFELAMAT